MLVPDAGGVGTLHGLFNPLDRQMLSQSAPVRLLKVVGKEVESIVEHYHAG